MQTNTQQAHSYLDQLNTVQRQAATATEGPVLVVAGPGSGKTRVLTFRIAHLIEKGVAPWEILALTFTNKAAREMKERIEKVVGSRAHRVWAGTFHSIFARILRVEAAHIGYPSNFTIYDSDDTKSVITAIINELNLNKEQYNVNSIRARISSCKSNLVTPKMYVNDASMMEEDRQAKRPYFYQIYEKYVGRCKRSGAMDFDDLLFRLYELFQNHPEVTDKYRKKFRYLMVDEFQDTNYLQYAIVKKFVSYEGSPRNICVVGDDAQSIYGFRGATIQNILDYESDFKQYGIRTFKLEENYRSTEHIVQAANEVISFNRRQIQKTIFSNKGDGQLIKVIKAMTDSEEGKRVADFIIEQKNRHHLANKEIAILYRTNSQSRVFEEWLRHFNITYKVFGGMSFYQRKEVKDIIAYLRLAINQRDDEALRRVINYPSRKIGKTTIEKLSAAADQAGRPIWEILPSIDLPGQARNAIDGFVALIEDFAEKAQTLDAHTMAEYIARRSRLMDELKQDTTVEGIGRLDNVTSLLDGIKTFVEDDVVVVDGGRETEDGDEEFLLPMTDPTDKSLAAYLQNIALMTDLDTDDGNTDYVTLMSVHSAKGLEFKSVFVAGMEEQLFPSFMSMDTPEGLDEERRLFYVAITRAEQFLTLSYAASRYRYGQERYNPPSRFLDEINLEHLDAATPVGSQAKVPYGRFEQAAFNGGATVKTTSGVTGNFKPRGASQQNVLRADPKTFKPSPADQIQAGMKVMHLKFGEGKVLAIDGAKDKRMATIFFNDLEVDKQKRIMLKFAKLEIVG
ncbi:MAG: UvrD-helicase domain-containing protein [Lewinellaceae bacterium]|nr:UvrD-helicase domain-containing protein [Saprospiraceae bacterium]MCB9340359.1 UvrD-helicase domain-containing protein [Lewinellaceae bacterium]